MEKCFIQKLKQEVQNDNLYELGTFVVNVKLSTSGARDIAIYAAYNKQIEVEALDGGTFTFGGVSGLTSATIGDDRSPNHNITCENKEFRLKIKNKYDIVRFFFEWNSARFFDIVPSDVEYSAGLTDLRVNIDGSMSFLNELTNLTNLNLGCSKTIGSLSNLSNCTNIASLALTNSQHITGNLSELGKLTSLNSCNISVQDVRRGDIVDFVSSQIQNGRSTIAKGSAITVNNILNMCTFNGNIYSDSANKLMWSSASKIAVFSSTKAYLLGATSSEIEEWEQDGKEVVVVD